MSATCVEKTKKQRLLSPADAQHLFKLLDSSMPNPRSDLNFINEFELLVAVVLSAQSTDVVVNQVTPRLFSLAPTPYAMAQMGRGAIVEQIRRLGLYNNKAKNLDRLARILTQKHQGKVPSSREELEALPGVGRKSAGVVLNIAFGKAEIPVDTHVHRLANRTGLAQEKTPEKTEQRLLKITPNWAKPKAHHLLILHGRYVCKAKKPDCGNCLIHELCLFCEKSVALQSASQKNNQDR